MNLTIRRMREQDLEPLHALLSDPETMRFLEPPYTREQTEAFLRAGMSEKPPVYTAEADGSFIGYVIFHAYEEDTTELGWVLLPEYRGRGYASALTEQMIRKAADEGKKPVIECDPEQKISAHIAMKSGLVRAESRDGLDVYRLPEREGKRRNL